MLSLEGLTVSQVGDVIRRQLVPDLKSEIRRLTVVSETLASCGRAGDYATILQVGQALALLEENLRDIAWSLHGNS